jgi:hypothetical protein
MTRTDLQNKRIEKLNSIEEMHELVSILTYEECIEVLKRCHNLPAEIVNHLVEKAKKEAGKMTLEIVMASMQTALNK